MEFIKEHGPWGLVSAVLGFALAALVVGALVAGCGGQSTADAIMQALEAYGNYHGADAVPTAEQLDAFMEINGF